MVEAASQLSELEALFRHMSPGKRAVLLKAITELFVENNSRYMPAQVTLFDRLFNQLVNETEKTSAAMLSRQLAAIDNIPAKIVDRLARDDDITVAEPVLMRSQSLDDATLIDIARNKGQTHLLAIACRPRLDEAIVDLLVARGDETVVRYVANNRGARLSESGATTLVERAKTDEALAILIRGRDDIPVQLRGMLAPSAVNPPPAAA
jgi:uncharacterized protein (DUF2336 family)